MGYREYEELETTHKCYLDDLSKSLNFKIFKLQVAKKELINVIKEVLFLKAKNIRGSTPLPATSS